VIEKVELVHNKSFVLFKMVTEYITTFLVLILTLVILWIVHYSLSIKRLLKKYSHIPGPTSPGIKVLKSCFL
jgi:hypothetical protein